MSTFTIHDAFEMDPSFRRRFERMHKTEAEKEAERFDRRIDRLTKLTRRQEERRAEQTVRVLPLLTQFEDLTDEELEDLF